MCHEGGCGSCIVAVRSQNAFTKERLTYAVNSVSFFCLYFTTHLDLMTKCLGADIYLLQCVLCNGLCRLCLFTV
jgi:hypothetical protein